MPSIDTGAAYIGSILRDGKPYLVPKYQRDYSWTSDETEQLWEDIFRAINEKQNTYFIGSIVINDGNSAAYEVIDGQQRLTTISVMLCALRDYAKVTGQQKLAERLESDFLGKFDYSTQETVPKLTLNINNRTYFNEKIVNNVGIEGLKQDTRARNVTNSNKLLAKSYLFFRDMIDARVSTGTSLQDFVQQVVEALDDIVQVIKITVKDDYDAYMLFETLNDRGLALSVADLLKNYLFSKADDRIEEVQSNWALMSQSLGKLELKRFLRHVWLSKHGIVRDKELFQKIKARYSNKNQVLSLSKELRDSAELYAALSDSQASIWSMFDEPQRGKVSDAIEELKLFGVNQYNPLLLATLEARHEIFLSVLRAVVAFAFRYSIILGAGTGNIEKTFTNAALYVRNNPTCTDKDVFARFESLYPKDIVFVDAFSKKSFDVSAMARHILRRINDDWEAASGLVVNRKADVVNLEHILPQRYNAADWLSFSDDVTEVSEYVSRLGNMTLLLSGLNSRVSNSSFQAKLSHYSKSQPMKISEDVFGKAEWKKADVEERQAMLANRAAGIWKVEFS